MSAQISCMTGLPAPAKMNLFLHVVGRRPDGMHLLESLFVLIDLMDTLDITCLPNGDIERTGDVVGSVADDLCVRAARLLQRTYGVQQGARIHVTKRIPSGAGLGGGSSDAATTLLALNRLWGIDATRQELMALGQTLGADVPFFVFGRNAFATGTGNELSAFAVPAAHWAIVMPGMATSTARIFSAPDLTRDTKSMTMSVLSDQVRANWPELFGHNDLQSVALRVNPHIRAAMDFLGPHSRMTGSGSAVFVWAESRAAAQAKLSGLPRDMRGYSADTLEVHPLFDLCRDRADRVN